MTITWCCSLAILLKELKGTFYKEEKVINCSKNQIKRFGIYFMCIDNLTL